jgi:methylglutaconyl-CoA hydratase
MSTQIHQGSLTTTINNKVATITFGHPAGNSFPASLLRRLTEELSEVDHDDMVNVIVLKSEGNGPFCAGASFDELLAVENSEQGAAFFSGFANVINAMRKCRKPIIGHIQGKAVGGGVGLAAACDYTIAHEAAAIRLSELAIGIGPFVIEPAVSRKIGNTATGLLAWAPTEWKSAQWAFGHGLYSELLATHDELAERVVQYAEQLASFNPDALMDMKAALWEGTGHWGSLLYERAAISGRLVLSDFTRKALRNR